MNEAHLTAFFDELEKIAGHDDIVTPALTGSVTGAGLAALSGEGLTEGARRTLLYGLDRAKKVPEGPIRRLLRDKGVNIVADSVKKIRPPYKKLVLGGGVLGALLGARKGATRRKNERRSPTPLELLT